MQTCPKCGNKFEEPDNGLIGPQVARAAVEALGGASAIGTLVAGEIQAAEDGSHRKMILMSQLRGWVQDGDKAQASSKQLNRGISEDQMKPVLLEYAMQLLETDEGFQRKVLSVAANRGLLQRLTESVIETEGTLICNG